MERMGTFFNNLIANPETIQVARDFIGAALPTTSPAAVTKASLAGAIMGRLYDEYNAYRNNGK